MAGSRPTRTREWAPHKERYITFYMPPGVTELIDELKARWRLNGRGKVIERLVRAQLRREKEKTDEIDIESRI